MTRLVEPELLDDLPAHASDARDSRLDLVRVNRLMGHARLICQALAGSSSVVVDLGAGDGTLLLDVVHNHPANVKRVVLVDRQRVVTETTLERFNRLGVEAEVVVADVFRVVTAAAR